jgi:hypothetical protein
VVGRATEDLGASDLASLRRRLRGLIKAMGLDDGAYATGLVRTTDHTEIHCRFAERENASAFGARFDARPATGYPGFVSCLRFVFDDAVLERLQMAATPARPRRAPGRPRKNP